MGRTEIAQVRNATVDGKDQLDLELARPDLVAAEKVEQQAKWKAAEEAAECKELAARSLQG